MTLPVHDSFNPLISEFFFKRRKLSWKMDLETLIVSTTCHRICKTDTNFWTCHSSRVTFVHFGWTNSIWNGTELVPLRSSGSSTSSLPNFYSSKFSFKRGKDKKIIVLQEIRERANKSVSVQATCGERKSNLISMTIMTDNGYTPCGSLWNIQTRKYTYKPF